MMLRLIPSKITEHVSPQDTLDYGTFNKKHRGHPGASELKQFERFHASRHLISKEMDTYLDAQIGSEDSGEQIKVDVCGLKNKTLTAVFCQTGERGPPAEYMETINGSQNAT